VCNLWFSNPGTDTVRKQLRDVALPSHKWLPLIYQLAAKLGVATVGNELSDIVERCVREHPHHTLFVLIALKNGRKDGAARSGRGGGGSAADARSSSTLIDTVEELLKKVWPNSHVALALHLLHSRLLACLCCLHCIWPQTPPPPLPLPPPLYFFSLTPTAPSTHSCR